MAINKNKINDNALKYIQKGQIKKAIREYDKILNEDPKDVRTLLKKGDLLVRVGDKEQALNTYFSVAKTYSQQGFHLKAVAVYKQILKIDESRIDVNLQLAGEYRNLGIVGDAIGHLQKVAIHYEQRGMKKQLVEILRQLLDLDQDNVASRIKLAELYSQEGMSVEAVEEFGQAAQYLKVTNRIEDYIKVVERLLYHDSSDLALVREIADIYLKRGDAKRALSKLQACFKADPSDIITLSMLATAFKDLHQPVKTISVYKEMLKIYQERGQDQELQNTYRQILELSPEDPEALQALNLEPTTGLTSYRAKDKVGAIPEEVVPMVEETDLSHNRPTPSEPQLEAISEDQIMELDPNLPEYEIIEEEDDRVGSSGDESDEDVVKKMMTETEVYIKYGLQNKAINHLKQIIDLDLDNVEAHHKLKDIYMANKQFQEASSQLLTLVHLSYRQGRIEEAREHLRALLILSPDHPQAKELINELGELADNEEEVENLLDEGLPSLMNENGIEVDIEEPQQFELPAEKYPEKMETDLPVELDQEIYLGIGSESDDSIELISSDYEVNKTYDEDEIRAKLETIEPDNIIDEPVEELSLGGVDDSDFLLKIGETGEYGEDSEVADYLDILEADSVLDDEHDIQDEMEDESGLIEIGEVDPSFDDLEEDLNGSLGVIDDPTQMIEVDSATWHKMVKNEDKAAVPDEFEIDNMPEHQVDDYVPEDDLLNDGVESIIEIDPNTQQEDEDEESDELDDLNDAIEEVDFFIQQNLIDEALEELMRLQEQYPDNLEINTRLGEIARFKQGEAPVAAEEIEEMEATGDLAEQIACEIEDDVEPVALDEDFQYSVTDVFDEFKKGVAKIVDKDDSSTHYDLGIAYKEMELLDEAISEFSIASSNVDKRVVSFTMIGLCYIEKNENTKAVEYFQEAMKHPKISEQEKTSLYYEMGRAFEKNNQIKEALLHFKKVLERDTKFRDVTERVSKLSQANQTNGGSDSLTTGQSTNGKNKISYM